MINTYLGQQIKTNFPYKPTFEQEKVVKILADFLLCREMDSLFLLKGYAGTGKTSLIGALVKTLDQLEQKCVLLAPTGRAAKVFAHYSGHPTKSITCYMSGNNWDSARKKTNSISPGRWTIRKNW